MGIKIKAICGITFLLAVGSASLATAGAISDGIAADKRIADTEKRYGEFDLTGMSGFGTWVLVNNKVGEEEAGEKTQISFNNTNELVRLNICMQSRSSASIFVQIVTENDGEVARQDLDIRCSLVVSRERKIQVVMHKEHDVQGYTWGTYEVLD